MFTPLPLRLCCMAAMAPALTEAATQARVKLTTVPSVGGTSGLGVANGRQCPPSPKGDHTDRLSPITEKPHLNLVSSRPLLPVSHTLIHKPINSAPSVPLTANSAGKNLVNLGIIRNLPNIYRKERLSVNNRPQLVNGDKRLGQLNSVRLVSQLSNSQGGPTHNPRTMSINGYGIGQLAANKGTSMGYIVRTQTPRPTVPSASQGTAPLSTAPPTFIGELSSVGVAGPSQISQADEHLQIGLLGDSTTIHHTIDPSSSGMSEVGVLTNIDLVAETTKRQREMERRTDRLVRRVRRLQSRQAASHIQQQLSGFVDHQHKNLQSMAKAMKVPPATNVDLKTELLHSQDVKSLSTAALVNLVRRLQSTQAISLHQRLANQSHQSAVSDGGSSVLKLEEDLCVEMNRVSSTLQLNLHHLQSAMDSDATESSSGGESCDEMDFDYDDEKLPKPHLHRRAEWKWAVDRAAVAARWTWLQAQVSDLEYRIRQQGDIYKQIRATKGAVTLGEPPPPEDLMARGRAMRPGRKLSPLEEKIANLERKNELSPCNLSTLLSNVDKQSCRLTKQLGNVYSPQSSPLVTGQARTSGLSTPKTPTTPNGYVDPSGTRNNHDTLDSDLDTLDPAIKRARTEMPLGVNFDPPSPAIDNSCQSARCRPVQSYGKRRLLRTLGLHQTNRKASRLSTVRCYCYCPTAPCAMCGGRYNNIQSLDPDVMPLSERVSLLDSSFHPVLSFPQDIPLPVHFETLLKSGDWKHKSPPKPLRPLAADKRKGKLAGTDVRKYNKKVSKNASAAMLSSAKIKNKYENKQLTRGQSGSLPTTPKSSVGENSRLSRTADYKLKKRKAALHAIDAIRKKHRVLTLPNRMNTKGRNTPSPIPGETLGQSGSSSTFRDMKDAMRRRRGESAFDINNIVIPYSMAASTRVEKLQYKEIITPKWREIEEPVVKKDESIPESSSPSKTDASTEDTENLPTAVETPAMPESKSEEEPLPKSTEEEKSVPESTAMEEKPAEKAAQNVEDPKTEEPKPDVTMEPTTSSASDVLATPDAPVEKATASSEVTPTTPSEVIPTAPAAAEDNDDEGLVMKALPGDEESLSKDKTEVVEGQRIASITFDEVETRMMEEDLSEDQIAARHMRCEIKEKKRFSSFVSLQKRGRGSRSDTDTGTASPEPLLPEVGQPPDSTLATLNAASTQLVTPPTTPASGSKLTPVTEELGEVRNRSGSCGSVTNEEGVRIKRITSAGKLRSRSVSHSEEHNPFPVEVEDSVPAWESRTFPLNEEEYDHLLKEPVPSTSTGQRTHALRPGYSFNATPDNSNPCSPLPSSSSSSVMEDDPDDPEWTVVSAEKAAIKAGIVLKLAKR